MNIALVIALIKKFSYMEIIDTLAELDALPAITDANGAMLMDGTGAIVLV